VKSAFLEAAVAQANTRQGATLFSGAALAAVLGVMLGGAMQPQLAFGDRPMGPQMFATGGGQRSTGPFDNGVSYATAGGEIPSYVIGTDYAQQAYVEAPPIAEERRQLARNDDPPQEPATMARGVYDEPAPIEVVYPSVAGGAAYGAEPPPEDDPPAITG